MSFVRKSKYRHVYGDLARPENQYSGIPGNAAQLDTSMIKVNGKYIAHIVGGTGGGVVEVFPMTDVGRHTTQKPRITGHAGPVTDLDFNPFNQEVIATTSQDCGVRVFKFPEEGIPAEGLNTAEFEGKHGGKATQLLWNPAASGILASIGAEHTVRIWDVEAKAQAYAIERQHGDTIQDFQWNQVGNYIATLSKDKKLRMFDVRANQKVLETPSHEGSKTAKLVFDNTRNWILSVGFGTASNRQLRIWDIKNPSTPLYKVVIDQGSGVMTPYFDEATQILFVSGKGEKNIRYYELTDEKPHCFYLATSDAGNPQRGIAALPKRFVDTKRCEIVRFYRLSEKATIEPISMIVPRKSEMFQEDIYPPVVDHCTPSMTAEEWKSGKNTLQRYYVFNEQGTEQFIDADKVGAAAVTVAPTVAAAAPAAGASSQELDAAKKRIAELEAKVAELEKQHAEDLQKIADLSAQLDSQ